MKKKLYSIFSAILIAMLMASPAGAGGVTIKPRLGSLILDITAWGQPNSTDYVYSVDASGIASVVCTNQGGNAAPGRNFPHVDGQDSKTVTPKDITKAGKVVTSLEAVPPQEDPDFVFSGKEGGCPNNNWSAKADFVFWQAFTFTIKAVATGEITTFEFSCVTTRTGPNSTPSTFDDGTVSCTRVN